MDVRHFDALVKALATPDSRRRLLALVATLPVVGGLLDILAPADTEGRGRRRRRKKAHKHGRRRRRKPKKKKCTANSAAQTCAGKCGTVTNNCNKPVDCGSCDCSPACETCFACQGGAGVPGACVADDGAACSSDPCLVNQTCNTEGECGGGEPKCPGQNCDNGTCTPLTCAQQCADCQRCMEKADGTRVCATGSVNTGCQPCSSDAECTGIYPVCVALITSVADGISFSPCPTIFPGPACVSFTPCG